MIIKNISFGEANRYIHKMLGLTYVYNANTKKIKKRMIHLGYLRK